MAPHTLPPPLSQAFARLRASVSGLESAAERQKRQTEQQGSLATELALMQDDRARLASELDSAMARADRLAKSAKEVDKRLVGMARTIKKVLGDDKGGEKGDTSAAASGMSGGQGGLDPVSQDPVSQDPVPHDDPAEGR